MPLEIRKLVTYAENMLIEGGRGFVEDLHPEIRACAPFLGESPTGEILRMAGSGDAVEGYGKAAVVGIGGEVDHASALIHTLHFGNLVRKAVGAKSYLIPVAAPTRPSSFR